MPFLVDGNNLLGQTPGLKLRDPKSRLQLIQRICAHQHRKGGRYTIFFDGEPDRGPARLESHLGGVTVRYSGRGVSADEAIKRALRSAAHPREWTVISSDRELAVEFRHLGARSVDCAEFNRNLARLESEPLRRWEKSVSASEVEEWLKIFGEK